MVASEYMIEYCGMAYVNKIMVICLMMASAIGAYVLRDVVRLVSSAFYALAAFFKRR